MHGTLQLSPEQRAIVEAREKDERVLVYRNLLDGVPVWKVMEVFRKSEKEIMDIFRHVSAALMHYSLLRHMPPVFSDAIAVAQKQKRYLLPLITKVNLDKPIARVTHNNIGIGETGGALRDMAVKQKKVSK